MASDMAERLALLKSFQLYAHQATELELEHESDSTSGSDTSTESGSGGEAVAGKTHGDANEEDSGTELKRKRVRENQRNRRRRAKLEAREVLFQKEVGFLPLGTQKKLVLPKRVWPPPRSKRIP